MNMRRCSVSYVIRELRFSNGEIPPPTYQNGTIQHPDYTEFCKWCSHTHLSHATAGNYQVQSYSTEHPLIIQPNNHEKLVSTQKPAQEGLKQLYSQVQLRCFSGKWTRTVVHPATEHYSPPKGNELLTHEKTLENMKCIWLSGKKKQKANLEKFLTVRFQLYNTLEMTILWRQTCIGGCQGLDRGWMRRSRETFYGGETILYIIHITHRMYNSKTETYTWTMGFGWQSYTRQIN